MNKCEILVHISAASTLIHDKAYLAVAQSVLDFQPISREYVTSFEVRNKRSRSVVTSSNHSEIGVLLQQDQHSASRIANSIPRENAPLQSFSADICSIPSEVTKCQRVTAKDASPEIKPVSKTSRDNLQGPPLKKARLCLNSSQASSHVASAPILPPVGKASEQPPSSTASFTSSTVTASPNELYLRQGHRSDSDATPHQSPISVHSSFSIRPRQREITSTDMEQTDSQQSHDQSLLFSTTPNVMEEQVSCVTNPQLNDMFAVITSLPQYVTSPLADDESTSQDQDYILTRSLRTICDRLPAAQYFRPLTVSRRILSSECGVWHLRFLVSDLDVSPSAMDVHRCEEQQEINSRLWSVENTIGFWNNLSTFVRDGKAGKQVQLKTESFLISSDCTEKRKLEVHMSISCSGYTLAAVWLLMWVLSDKMIAGVKSYWEDAGGAPVVTMSGNRFKRGALGIWQEMAEID